MQAARGAGAEEVGRSPAEVAGMPEARSIVRGLARDIALNATIPVACYFVMTRFVSPSELAALLVATAFPTLTSVYDVTRRHELNPVAVLVLLGILGSILALLVGGDPRLLLIRESFVTGAFGIACLVSLAFPRPIMFYFARYLMSGGDAGRRAVIDERWQYPAARRAHRIVTVVWGLVFIGEFALRVLLVYAAPAALVLAVSPFVTGCATILTIMWTLWYARKSRANLPS
jgi:hypothetical protein